MAAATLTYMYIQHKGMSHVKVQAEFGRPSGSGCSFLQLRLEHVIIWDFKQHLFSGFQGRRLKCCSVNFNDFHPECFPIRLPDDDPVHGKRGEKCQEYARSGTAPRIGCTLG